VINALLQIDQAGKKYCSDHENIGKWNQSSRKKHHAGVLHPGSTIPIEE
jgi:hypothetical protein